MELTDAQKMAIEYPKTFEVPTQLALDAIDIGAAVWVSNGYERFWVLVTGTDGPKIEGTINNKLIGPRERGAFGDEIEFEHRHVYQIYGSR